MTFTGYCLQHVQLNSLKNMDSKHSHELESLFDNSPSVLRNSAVILVVRISGWVLSLVCLGLGIAFLLNQFTRPITDWLREPIAAEQTVINTSAGEQPAYNTSAEQYLNERPEVQISVARVEKGLGIGFLVLAVVLMLVVRLCKMIMRRNGFVLNLFGWHEQMKKEIRQKMAGESKK